MRVWQRQDSRFRVPRGALYINFLTARVNDSAASAAASQLYVDLLLDSVNEFTYPALLAGLNFGIATNDRGISLSISGYDDKQMVLLSRIVDSIASAELDTHRFDNIRRDLIRSLENVKTARASSQVIRQGRRVLLSGRYPEAALIAELESLTPERVAAHADILWNSSSVDILLNGNYPASAAADVRRALVPLTRHAMPTAPPAPRLARLSAGDDVLYRADVEHDDAVMLWYLQGPDDSMENRARAGLTGQVISANYFEQLRTEQQLGYVVSAFSWPLLDVPAVAMLIQSPGSTVPEIVSASRTFLQEQAEPGAVTEEQFLRHRDALLQEILKPHKNIWEESAYFWREIERRNLAFDSRDRVADAVRSTGFTDWQAWYRRHILDEPASLLIAAPGRSGVLPDAETAVTDAASFRESWPYYQRD
jgi:secreted Zn-dependent insulinase-like peptidase